MGACITLYTGQTGAYLPAERWGQQRENNQKRETPGETGRAGLGPLWFGMGGGAEGSVIRQAGERSAARRETG